MADLAERFRLLRRMMEQTIPIGVTMMSSLGLVRRRGIGSPTSFFLER
jgi:hypothetical protein